jgi:hypothetical protein
MGGGGAALTTRLEEISAGGNALDAIERAAA